MIKSLSLMEVGKAPMVKMVPPPKQEPGTVKVRLTHAALNRRDVWITKGQYPKITTPVTLGSDGVGTLVNATASIPSQTRVVIYPGRHWGSDEAVQSKSYEILGMPTAGTFAQEIVVPEHLVYRAPEHLTNQEAAALPLAGLTAWRSTFSRGELKGDETLLVTGIGGGVATLAAQFGIAKGARVHATSSCDAKLSKAMKLGCISGTRYDGKDFSEQLRSMAPGGFHVIVDGAGGSQVGTLLKHLAPAGRFVFYGGTAGKWPAILPQRLFYKQVSLLASTMGSPSDFEAMLAFVADHEIRPIVDRVFPLCDGASAFEYLESNRQMGKVVLSIE